MADKDRDSALNRTYTDKDIAMAQTLHSLYHSIPMVSKELGIPEVTIRHWVYDDRRGNRAKKINEMMVASSLSEHLTALAMIRDEALAQVHRKLPDASAAQAATIYGILTDKALLLMQAQGDNATDMYDTRGMSDEEKLEMIRQAYERQKEQRVIEAVNATVVADSDSDG